MRRVTIEQWISQAMDGELSASRTEKLERVLRDHPAYADLRRHWQVIGMRMRDPVPQGIPTPEVAWIDVRRGIRLENEQADEAHAPGGFGARVRWAGAFALLLLLGWSASTLWRGGPDLSGLGLAEIDGPGVEWVETDLPGASPMVYRDDKTGCTVIWVMANDEDGEHVDS